MRWRTIRPMPTRRRRIAALTVDLSELLPDLVPRLKDKLRPPAAALGTQPPMLAFHPPCTLQHGQQLRGGVETHLQRARLRRRGGAPTKATCAAARPAPTRCCSPSSPTRCATASSSTSPSSRRHAIVSANIGCIQHLQTGTPTPVRHWVEVLDDALAG